MEFIDVNLNAERVGWDNQTIKQTIQKDVTDFKLSKGVPKRENEATKINAEDTEHMKRFRELLNFFWIYDIMYGLRLSFDYKFGRRPMHLFTSALLISGWICATYTMWLHFKTGQYVRMLEPLSVLGFLLSCTWKWSCYVVKLKPMLALIFFSRKLCRENVTGLRSEIIRCGLSKTIKMMWAPAILLLLSGTVYIFTPLKSIIVDNVWMTLIPSEVLFCDKSTLSGFIAANLVQTVQGIYSAMGAVLYSALFCSCIYNYNLLVDLLRQDFMDLDEMWKCGNVSIQYRHAYLKNICLKRMDMNNYLNVVKDIFNTKLTFYFGYAYLCQIICLFEITVCHWLSGFPVAMGLFSEMMIYCNCGTQISISDDKLCELIAGSNWHTYDLKSQRIVQMLLKEAQQSKEMQLGLLGTLDLVTGIQMVKGIYSYYTILTELL